MGRLGGAMKELRYCRSRFGARRNETRAVNVGSVGVGGGNPVRVQSMVNTPTQDVAATVKQSIALAEAGCEIIRITAQNVEAARCLKAIRKEFSAAGFSEIPLVADIHFLPKAAMEAVEHVEKVRVNPGNYADKKKFAIKEYTDALYEEELERLHEAFSPLVLRAKALGRALRIGTNHGSLSDRIMNRYGDTPVGMAESALEFIRIAESHGFHDMILSMKASNPKVMVSAYRHVVAMMREEGMAYPLHLGVTEAGDGEDARIKSAVGMGSLLMDGLGDTVRVSLTEDPVYELPIARDLAEMAHALWEGAEGVETEEGFDGCNPYVFERREIERTELGQGRELSLDAVPPVIVKSTHGLGEYERIAKDYLRVNSGNEETRVEGLMVAVESAEDWAGFEKLQRILASPPAFYVLELASGVELEQRVGSPSIICKRFEGFDAETWGEFYKAVGACGGIAAFDIGPGSLEAGAIEFLKGKQCVVTSSRPQSGYHAVGTYRKIADILKEHGVLAPIWVRNTAANAVRSKDYFTARLLEGSSLSGSLICDGIGDVISVEEEPDMERANALCYNILQGVRMRMSKTEFVACPSCGRTLFDLEETTQKIREATGHLKGVTIAVMGCIVNGPGEMADADFGYVGGAPGKINLYVGKECVQYHIPQEEAVGKLIDLIKEYNMWVEKEPESVEL